MLGFQKLFPMNIEKLLCNHDSSLHKFWKVDGNGFFQKVDTSLTFKN